MKTKNKRSPRGEATSKLFALAKEKRISPEMVREDIAFKVNGKRLSQSSVNEIYRVVDHIAGTSRARQYAPGIGGLKLEIKDLAMTRWGDGWEESLNAFCKAFKVDHHRVLNIPTGKKVRDRLKEMNKDDGPRKGAKRF